MPENQDHIHRSVQERVRDYFVLFLLSGLLAGFLWAVVRILFMEASAELGPQLVGWGALVFLNWWIFGSAFFYYGVWIVVPMKRWLNYVFAGFCPVYLLVSSHLVFPYLAPGLVEGAPESLFLAAIALIQFLSVTWYSFTTQNRARHHAVSGRSPV
jgi:hypothetical protein